MSKTKDGALAILLLAVLVGAGPAMAQDALVAPARVTAPMPPQPTGAGGRPLEGWVTVRYSVLADGSPTDIRAINVMPPSLDPAAALETFGRWTFSPGTHNGETVDWHNNETVIVFSFPAEASESSATFRDGHEAVAALIDDGSFDEALAANTNLLENHATRLTDIGLALTQSAIIHIGRLDFHAALDPVRMATDPRVPVLGSADLFAALQLRMQIEDGLGRVREALATHERLTFGLGGSDPNTSFALVGQELEYLSENREILEVVGRIGADASWRINLGRRIFTIDPAEDSRIESIDAECDTHKTTLPYQPEVDWHLPDSFGDCTLFVNGEPGTRFTFYELLPAEEPAEE